MILYQECHAKVAYIYTRSHSLLCNTMVGGGRLFGSGYFSVTKMYGPMLFALGVVQNCQHYQKRTQSTLICDPLPPFQKSTLKMLIFNDPVWKCENNFFFKAYTIDPRPRVLCVLLWKWWQFWTTPYEGGSIFQKKTALCNTWMAP